MRNYFPLDLGKFILGTFDLILIVLGHLIKGQRAFEKEKKKQEKMFACLETRARSEGYMVKIFKAWCPKP